MRKPIAPVNAAAAFRQLAASLRYDPHRLALLRRIYVERVIHQEAPWPRQQFPITFNVPGSHRTPSSPRL